MVFKYYKNQLNFRGATNYMIYYFGYYWHTMTTELLCTHYVFIKKIWEWITITIFMVNEGCRFKYDVYFSSKIEIIVFKIRQK